MLRVEINDSHGVTVYVDTKVATTTKTKHSQMNLQH
jgi:hypothetical protein